MRKYFTILMVTLCAVMMLTSCENAVKLDSLAGTKWQYNWNSNDYQTYYFKGDGTATHFIHVEGDGESSLPLNWTCTSSGYVKTTVQVTNKLWKTGTFNGDKGTLVMDGYKFKLISHK